MALGFLMAIVVSFGTALFAEYFDHSVNTAEDAQHCLGLPILAVIPEFSAGYTQTSYARADEKHDDE